MLDKARLQVQLDLTILILKSARDNIPAVEAHSEEDTLAYLARYDVVFAVWCESETLGITHKKLKGPEGYTTNGIIPRVTAIPVADEAEARRWSALLAGSDAPKKPARLKIAARNGVAVDA